MKNQSFFFFLQILPQFHVENCIENIFYSFFFHLSGKFIFFYKIWQHNFFLNKTARPLFLKVNLTFPAASCSLHASNVILILNAQCKHSHPLLVVSSVFDLSFTISWRPFWRGMYPAADKYYSISLL